MIWQRLRILTGNITNIQQLSFHCVKRVLKTASRGHENTSYCGMAHINDACEHSNMVRLNVMVMLVTNVSSRLFLAMHKCYDDKYT